MTIIGDDPTVNTEGVHVDDKKIADKNKDSGNDSPFSEDNIQKNSVVRADDSDNDITITSDEKASFIEAVANNDRFTKKYSLFGGKLTITIRSLTADEVNALAVWTTKQSMTDAAGIVSGRYRKFLAAAQCAMVNGVEMPPLEDPLFERIGADGKTVDPPGWVSRGAYFDGMEYGQFQAIMKCIENFDAKYAMLCSKAEDSNFWNPDTP